MVLPMVLVVTALAAMVAASFLFQVRAEVAASSASGTGEWAHAAAMCGIRRAMSVLAAYADDPSQWRDAPALFQDQPVWDDGTEQWYFTVYAHNAADPTSPRYGLTDEAGKININTAPEDALRGLLARLTTLEEAEAEDLAQALIDRRSEGGGPLATVEELLLIEGFSAAAVYGEDANLNGLLEANENDRAESFPSDNADGELDRGLLALATAVSYEWDVDAEGQPRLDLNGELDGLEELDLPGETIEFIRQYREEGGKFTHPSQLLEMEHTLKGSGGGGSSGRRGGRWGRGSSGNQAGQNISSGVGEAELPVVMDRLTTASPDDRAAPLVGLVNVNTAPAEVLALVPGIGEDLARDIVEARAGLDAESLRTTAWLYPAVVSADEYKRIAPLLTARGRQFRVRCVGFGLPSGRYKVIEAVIDIADGDGRIIYLRDLTRLGLPVPLGAELVEGAR
jgi:hypothetical protein